MKITIRDRFGLMLTTSSALAAEHYIEGVDLLLEQCYGPEERFLQAIEADADFALAHAALGLARMVRENGDDRVSVDRARKLCSNASRREQQHVEAVSLFIHGQGIQALRLILDHLTEFPRDALLMRLANRLYTLGCSGAGISNYPVELYGMMRRLERFYGDDWVFLGQDAFAHHEMGYLDESLVLAERSLAGRPTSAHAAHSVAHVYFEKGNVVDGSHFLEEWFEGFDRRAPFNIHLSWHQALFKLAQAYYTDALTLYKESIRPSVLQKSATSLADSASLMWRMRLYSRSDASCLAEEIREQAIPATESPGPAFRDAHAALAFAATGGAECLERLRNRLETLAENGNPLAQEMTLPLVKGITAFAAEAYGEAVDYLEPLMPELARIGGSHAQREVFEDTLLEAYLRARQNDQAQCMLQERLNRRSSVRDRFWLARAQADTGATASAQDLLHQVAKNWQQADPDSPEVEMLHSLMTTATDL